MIYNRVLDWLKIYGNMVSDRLIPDRLTNSYAIAYIENKKTEVIVTLENHNYRNPASNELRNLASSLYGAFQKTNIKLIPCQDDHEGYTRGYIVTIKVV